jgi:hypothetical protein
MATAMGGTEATAFIEKQQKGNRKGRKQGSKNLTTVSSRLGTDTHKAQEQSHKAIALFTKYEGNWNQIWGSSEFHHLGIAQKKFENHVRSQLKRVQKKAFATAQKGNRERSNVLKHLKRNRASTIAYLSQLRPDKANSKLTLNSKLG